MDMEGTLARIKAREDSAPTVLAWEAAKTRYLAEAKRSTWSLVEVPEVHAELVSGEMGDAQARTEAARPRVLCCLSGPPGTGKTTAAVEWLRNFCHDDANYFIGAANAGFQHGRFPPLFVSAARLARWERYDDEKMRSLLRAARLVVDDLGTEYADAKGNFMAVLDELVAERAGNRRPTIITTNLDKVAFKAKYGERIADRIRESGDFISLSGPSMRKRA